MLGGMNREKKPRNPDHVWRVNVPGPQDETIQKQFEELPSPAVYAQSAFYRSLNLRDRILNLPLMIASILAMLWRQIPSVCELTKTLDREGALWMRPAKVSQPALSKRLLTFPDFIALFAFSGAPTNFPASPVRLSTPTNHLLLASQIGSKSGVVPSKDR